MKCPHCGEFIDNVLWKALAPYRAEKLPVVITNVDAILEVGNRIVAVFEEKSSHDGVLRVRGYQCVILKKIAKCLDVPLFIIEKESDHVKLFRYDTNQIVKSSPFVSADQLLPVFQGSVEEFGNWVYSTLISPHVPLSRERNRFGGGLNGRR
ncbi:MAG: hypothetical protein QW226_04330 [Archaeoglobaceae archaeon]